MFSNPAGLCCSSAHLVQCEPDEASSFTNPNVGLGTYAGLWLELDNKFSLAVLSWRGLELFERLLYASHFFFVPLLIFFHVIIHAKF